MENKDIIALSAQELKDRIKEEKSGLNKLQMNYAISPIENPIKIRSTRKLIARLSTELTKKEKASK